MTNNELRKARNKLQEWVDNSFGNFSCDKELRVLLKLATQYLEIGEIKEKGERPFSDRNFTYTQGFNDALHAMKLWNMKKSED